MPPGDTARLYHRLTSYSPEREFTEPVDDPRIVQGFVQNDYETVPPFCKTYPDGLPRVELPRDWEHGAAATLAVAGRERARPLSLATLARQLFLSSGVVRTSHRRGRDWLFRAAGSAGGRFPLELYVSARGVDGLDDGVHWYDPVGHALLRIGPAAGGEATTLVVTGVPWRTGWRYAERGFRHIYWDAGTMLSQALALAGEARLWSRFPDAAVTRLVGADGTHEFPVALVALEPGAPAIAPGGEAASGSIDAPPMEFPLVTEAQHAGDVEELGEPWPVTPLEAAPDSPALDEVILTRGSTRLMDATASVPRELFGFAIAAALRDTRVPHWVAVHAVDGLAPGLYRWPDLDTPRRAGDLREVMLRACWDQDLGRDAAFVVMAAIDLDQLDDRGYREAQLDAGIVEGRLHIAAYALGIGASGMTFLDSEIEPLLGDGLGGLLFTCVGVPSYRSKGGGKPGAPTSVVIPEAGLTLPSGERMDA
jgi:nitroreductase